MVRLPGADKLRLMDLLALWLAIPRLDPMDQEDAWAILADGLRYFHEEGGSFRVE